MDLIIGVLVLIDNILMICARIISSANIPYEHMKRPIWIILLNIVAAVPDIIMDPLFNSADKKVKYFLHLKDLLIIFHVINYSKYRLKMIRKQRVVLALYNYFLTTLCLFVVINYVFFLERCLMRNMKCDNNDRLNNFVNSVATIIYRCSYERTHVQALLLLQAVFSYLSYFCVFAPIVVEVIIALINKNRHKYAFYRKKLIVDNTLNISNAHFCVKMRIAEFFKHHWEKNVGYSDVELKPFLETMAPSVYEELVVDMNFKALKHSKLFQNMDLPFLRCVALAMKQTFALPGELLYQKNSNKHTMIYIVSGTVQVLSDQDGDTAILSLSAGTCIGEIALILNYNSTTSVVCKEYCVLQTLGIKEFVNIGRKFPKQVQRLRRMVSNRYGMAKKLKALENHLDTTQEAKTNNKRMRIMWLNSMLHRLMTKDETTSSQHMCQNIFLREDFDSNAYETVTSTATYLDLLAVAERTELVSDSVFHNVSSFPPILQPNSVLLNIWDILVCVPAILVCFTTPVYAFMYPFTPIWYWWLANVSTLLYVFDIYLTATTAVKKQQLTIHSFKEIFSYRLGTLTFWFDIIAAYPLQLHANSFLHEVSDMLYASLFLNRCFKFAKIMKVFKFFAKRCKWCRKKNTLIDYVYINLVLSYFVIFFTIFLHSILCQYEIMVSYCYENVSFVEALMFYFFYAGNFFYMMGPNLGEDSILNGITIPYIVISLITGTIFLFAITIMASKGIMSSFNQVQIIKTMLNLRAIADCLRVGMVCRNRGRRYINTQWDYNSCESLFFSSDVFSEMPIATYKLFKENSAQDFVKNMPIFKELSDAVIVELCTFANVIILPPKEVIAYKGEPATVIYYLIDGFVELVSGKNTARNIVGPGESLSVFEAYLNLPLLNTSVTRTDCRLLTLPWGPVETLVSQFDYTSAEYVDLKEQFVQIRTKNKSDLSYDLVDSTKMGSFKKFGYNLKLDSEEEYEYYVPFDRLQIFSFVQFMLLRVTFLPNGNFVFLWELSRSIFAIASAVLFTVPPVLTCRYCYWWWVLLFFDLTAVVDIYIKLHYCYYNDKGLLVTHPLKTASYYIKHSLLVDVIAVFPFRFFFTTTNAQTNRINAIFHFTRCLQLYRTCSFFKSTDLVPSIAYKLVTYLLALLITTFILSSVLVNTFCEFHEDISASGNFTDGVTCLEHSWFTIHAFSMQLNPWDVYIFSVNIVALFLANIDFWMYFPGTKVFHLIVKHSLTISGYCVYILLVEKFSVLLTNRADLFVYQRDLYLLKSYMRREKVGANTQRAMIQHCELQWKRNRDNGLYKFTGSFHKTLRADIIFDVYGKVLEESSIFHDVDRHFYKSLLVASKHEAYPSGFTICSLNDIMSMVYILYDGCVEVMAPDGTILTTLGVGSMFGNLDEYPRVRQTVGFFASGNVELLIVPTNEYFKYLKSYPKLYNAFKYLTAVHIDYLKGRLGCEVKKDVEIIKYAHNRMILNSEKICHKIWRFMLLLFVCYILNIFHIYLIAVNECNPYLYILLYICDFLYIVDVLCVRYLTAFTDETGNLITNLYLIRKKRNENKVALIVSLLATIPVDVPVWFIPMSGNLRCKLLLYLRLNRQLRLYDLFTYLNGKRKELNSNHTALRCIMLICFIGFMTQLLCCFYIKLCCLKRDATVFGRKFDCDIINNPQGQSSKKLINYGISLYVILSLILRAGQSFQVYKDIYLLLCMSMLALVTTILATYMFAEICSIMRSILFWRMIYESKCCHLWNFMKRRGVSQQMTKKIWNYVVFFWKRQSGVSLPKLLIEAPSPLKLKVMGYCYSHHIMRNVVFKKCHEDFIRQVVLMLRVDTYFSGDYIVFKGDINGCMYFIHSGSVLIMSEDTCKKEDVIGKLIVGQSFGILQGLYPSTAHVYYYLAASNCDILSLNWKAWMYLLDYFPASKEVIYSAAESYFGF